MIDPDGHAACRLLADECADVALRSKLTALRAAATAADAAVLAALTAALRAAAAADRAQAAADQPCRLGDSDDCAAWRHSRQATADRARAAVRTAWANVSAAARAAAAHRSLAAGERALAAARRRGGLPGAPVVQVGEGSKGVYANATINRYQLYPKSPRSTTVFRINDRSLPGPDGQWVVRADPAGARDPAHVNVNTEALGLTTRDPHLQVSSRTVAAAGATARVVSGAQRVALPVAIATDAWRLYDAVQADGGTLGPQTGRAALNVAGGWAGAGAGAWAGGQAGAALGAALGSPIPIVGNIVAGAIGGVAGGLIGGILGGIAGSLAGDTVFDFLGGG